MALVKCKECQKEVSSTAKSCPHCGVDLRDWISRNWTALKYGTIFFGLILLINMMLEDSEVTPDNDTDVNVSEESHASTRTINPANEDDQKRLHQMRAECNAAYDKGQNEIQKSDQFANSQFLTNVFANEFAGRFVNWRGDLKTISTDKGGEKLYVTIVSEIGDFQIKYTIDQCVFGCDGIAKGSAVYNQVRNLSEGNKVVFSGKFIRDIDGNVMELSITESGSMYYPEFRVEFTDIKPYSPKPKFASTVVEKHRVLKDKLDKEISRYPDNFRGFLKTTESNVAKEIEGDVELSENFEALFNVFTNSSGQVLFVSEYVTTPSGDWTILYSSYFEKGDKIILLEKKRRFFNQKCSQGVIMDTETIYFDRNFEKLSVVRVVVDSEGNNMESEKCGFYYDFDYKTASTASIFLNERGIELN